MVLPLRGHIAGIKQSARDVRIAVEQPLRFQNLLTPSPSAPTLGVRQGVSQSFWAVCCHRGHCAKGEVVLCAFNRAEILVVLLTLVPLVFLSFGSCEIHVHSFVTVFRCVDGI